MQQHTTAQMWQFNACVSGGCKKSTTASRVGVRALEVMPGRGAVGEQGCQQRRVELRAVRKDDLARARLGEQLRDLRAHQPFLTHSERQLNLKAQKKDQSGEKEVRRPSLS